MSRSVKTILVIVGILAALAIFCVGGLALFTYFYVDVEGFENARKEGAEFGKTTDNIGCQTKALELAKPVALGDLTGMVKVQYFNEGCLFASRPTPGFCDGLPSERSDILSGEKTKDALCEKSGMKDSLPCRSVMKARLEYCQKKR